MPLTWAVKMSRGVVMVRETGRPCAKHRVGNCAWGKCGTVRCCKPVKGTLEGTEGRMAWEKQEQQRDFKWAPCFLISRSEWLSLVETLWDMVVSGIPVRADRRENALDRGRGHMNIPA